MVPEDEDAIETVFKDVEVEMVRQGNVVTTMARWVISQELVGRPEGV